MRVAPAWKMIQKLVMVMAFGLNVETNQDVGKIKADGPQRLSRSETCLFCVCDQRDNVQYPCGLGRRRV